MKSRTLVLALVLIGVFVARGLFSQGPWGWDGSGGKFTFNPKPFDKLGAPISGPIRFLASERGKQILRMSPHPVARGLLKFFGEEVSGPTPSRPTFDTRSFRGGGASAGTGAGCGQLAGTPFNLEPRTGDPVLSLFAGGTMPMPQNEESVDFLRDRPGLNSDLIVGAANDWRGVFGGIGWSLTGFYVHTTGFDCRAQFDGGLPSIVDVNGITLFGFGDPVIAADPARDAFFAADLHFGNSGDWTISDYSVGTFRTTAATLTNPAVCPPGTHEYNDTACWPTSRALNLSSLGSTPGGTWVDKPHLAVDERLTGSGIGAGDVYVTNTAINMSTWDQTMDLVACKNDLSACSTPQTISGSDGLAANGEYTQLSHVSVRPDGDVTVSYVNIVHNWDECFGSPSTPCVFFDLKYVTCAAAGAPQPPSCSAPTLIVREAQPLLVSVTGEDFGILTYPKHDHQTEPDGTVQTIVVWDRCKVPNVLSFLFACSDADVVMTASNNNGVSWAPVTGVNTEAQHQFFPWIKTDRSTNITNIAYYSSENDPSQHRVQVFLNQIRPGMAIPNRIGPKRQVTTLLDETTADPVMLTYPFFGDYIGIAARGTGTPGLSRAYAHFTYNTNRGIYNGILAGEQNNHLSRLDY